MFQGPIFPGPLSTVLAAARDSPGPPASPDVPQPSLKTSFHIDAILSKPEPQKKGTASAIGPCKLSLEWYSWIYPATYPFGAVPCPALYGGCLYSHPSEKQDSLELPHCIGAGSLGPPVHWRSKGPYKMKRVRTVFRPEQLERLEQEFLKQQYMVGTERVDLAATLHLTETQVKVWFQNRRIKWRKQSLEQKKVMLSQFGGPPTDSRDLKTSEEDLVDVGV